ncbi:hypothetical protein MTsDn1_13290 [Alteromonas sp. MTD1]|uniref:response regulator n=1 Tax=Alteromonas sp. MTD1 TaxID=3057962 RepID=UPI0036F32BAD
MDKQVYYLEDNDVNYQVAEAMFELIGVTKLTRFSTLEELDTFTGSAASNSADLLVLDIMLPDGNSVSLLPKLKSHFSCPIVAFTAKSAPAEIEALLDAGFVDVFTKPVDFDFFERKVRHLL